METLALSVGKAVGERAARVWLTARSGKESRSKELIELMRAGFPDQLVRRKAERQIEDIADSVAGRVLKACSHEYPGLSDDDREVVLAEAVSTLTRADLSDRALFSADTDPVRLAQAVRAALPASKDLPEAASRLYEVVLDECCDCLVRIVRHLPEFQPRATSELLARISRMGEQVTLVLERLPARTLEAPDGTGRDSEFTRRYLQHVSETLDALELIGMQAEQYAPRMSLSTAYVSLSVSTQAGEPRDETWHEQHVPMPATVRVEQALGQGRRTLLRGEAGGGKSTLLRWLMITAARGGFQGSLSEWNGCVPFLIKLRAYADDALPRPEQFLDGVADPLVGLMPAGWVHRRLSSGQAMLLVDGVDELTGTQRRAVKPWLRGLLAQFGAVKVIVSSRPSAAQASWLKDEEFVPAFLERMTPSDTRALIEHWHVAVAGGGSLPCAPEMLPVIESRLYSQLDNSASLRSLASTPLLASMLCALNLDRAARLPLDRMGLYTAVLDMLLERRDHERSIPSYSELHLDREQKLQILQMLAWELSLGNRVELPSRVAETRIHRLVQGMPMVRATGQEVLRHLLERSGVIREPVPGRIDFVHRTVQEYLTARAAAQDGYIEPLIDYAHRDTWRETVVMAAGHVITPLRRELLEGLLRRSEAEPRRRRRLRLLIVACLETMPHVPEELRPAIEQCVRELVPPRDVSTARTLATGGQAVLDRLPAGLDGLTDAVAKATVTTAWLVNGPKAIDVLARYSGDRRVTAELVEGWRYFNPDLYARRILSELKPHRVGVTTAGQLRALRHLSGVEEVLIHAVDVPDLSPLPALRDSLTTLDLVSLVLGARTDPLGVLENLRQLSVFDVLIRDLNFLGGVAYLHTLQLGVLSSVSDYRPLRAVAGLRMLSLHDAQRLRDWADLPPLDHLRSLTVEQSPLVTHFGELVSRAPRLTRLNLLQRELPPDAEALGDLPLKHLTLSGTKGLFCELTGLARCSLLQNLHVSGVRVNDLRPLASLHQLRSLRLNNVSVGIDLAPLAELPHLKSVVIPVQRSPRNAALLGNRVMRSM
ncbi:NACHT domain-containing protein [Nonomuraea sp. PA05]|uniref:NACHT N-terminal Helical domain 1-containing protein n=1 Tax=Nonomuraea sp. PA05 TaxID=2604466 RepID=UPI0021CCC71C|nr:NACHT domain-containing protein [Nonomuraea sp. PA05]